MLAGVHEGASEAMREPDGISRPEVAWDWVRFGRAVGAWIVGEEVKINYGNQQKWMRRGTPGDDASGLEFDLGDAYTVFDKQDFLRAAVENVKAAVFLRMGGI